MWRLSSKASIKIPPKGGEPLTVRKPPLSPGEASDTDESETPRTEIKGSRTSEVKRPPTAPVILPKVMATSTLEGEEVDSSSSFGSGMRASRGNSSNGGRGGGRFLLHLGSNEPSTAPSGGTRPPLTSSSTSMTRISPNPTQLPQRHPLNNSNNNNNNAAKKDSESNLRSAPSFSLMVGRTKSIVRRTRSMMRRTRSLVRRKLHSQPAVTVASGPETSSKVKGGESQLPMGSYGGSLSAVKSTGDLPPLNSTQPRASGVSSGMLRSPSTQSSTGLVSLIGGFGQSGRVSPSLLLSPKGGGAYFPKAFSFDESPILSAPGHGTQRVPLSLPTGDSFTFSSGATQVSLSGSRVNGLNGGGNAVPASLPSPLQSSSFPDLTSEPNLDDAREPLMRRPPRRLHPLIARAFHFSDKVRGEILRLTGISTRRFTGADFVLVGVHGRRIARLVQVQFLPEDVPFQAQRIGADTGMEFVESSKTPKESLSRKTSAGFQRSSMSGRNEVTSSLRAEKSTATAITTSTADKRDVSSSLAGIFASHDTISSPNDSFYHAPL